MKMKLPLRVGSIFSFEELGGSKYVVAEELQGGMGTVYKLIPINPVDPPLALKTLQPSADLSAFLRECEIWTAISAHSNVAKLYWFGQYDNQPAVLAEWYPATLAAERLSEWSDDQIISLIAGMTEALQYASDKFMMIHQDIKPANVLVSQSREPKIADFGLARFSSIAISSNISLFHSRTPVNSAVSCGRFGGTPAYMAPELLVREAEPSISTDMFSLGVTLFESISGTHPYVRNGKFVRSPLQIDHKPLSSKLATRTKRLSFVLELVRSLMHPDPRQRPASYLAILGAIPSVGSVKIDSQDQIASVVAQARLSRTMGQYDQAKLLLLNALTDNPDHPILLNALGVLYNTAGDSSMAAVAFTQAYQRLQASQGKIGTDLYLDPVMNLARHLVACKSFPQAYTVLQDAWSWLQLQKGAPEYLRPAYWYWEFGWMHLYSGDYGAAIDYGLNLARSKVPDFFALQWLILASYFSETMLPLPQIARWVKQSRPLTFVDALTFCLAIRNQPEDQCADILDAVNQDAGAQITKFETDLGIPPDSFRPPVRQVTINALAQVLDHKLTGGRYSEYF
jgi:serine/threonine protein kinase